MNKYLPYTASELHILINELETVRNQPYMLHAAYALQSLTELALAEPEEDEEEPTIESMWGMTIPKKIIDRLVEDVAYDFNDAACNHKPIKIWGKSVSIRKANSYDRSRLSLIFSFQENEGKYTLAQDGIINLNNTSDSQANQYEAAKDEAKENRLYLRRIIKMAEDDANNGWDKLTDMEIVLYCWAMYFNKTQSSNYLDFKNKYKDYLYVNDTDIQSCYNAKAAAANRPSGFSTFSAEKVQEWNRRHNQKSKVEIISPQEADDYWYDVAICTVYLIYC